MPFVRIADTAKVELFWHDAVSLQEGVNVLHALLADADQSLANVQAMATAVAGVVVASGSKFWSVNWVFDKCVVTGLATATSNQATAVVSVPGPGSGDMVPGVAALVTMTTALRNRSGRGRIFWGGIPSNQILTGSGGIAAATVLDVNNFTSDIQTTLQGLTPASDLVVASKKLGLSHIVNTHVCEMNSAFQRRRSQR